MREQKFTPNRYRIEGDCAYLHLTTKRGEYRGETVIDLADLARVLAYGCWRIRRGEGRYVKCNRHNKEVLLHRYLTQPQDDQDVDHKNGNRRDNRRKNLRPCTRAQNAQNRIGATVASKSGVRGVYWYARIKRWRVRVQVAGRKHQVGTFATLEEAEVAAIECRKRLMPFATS